MPDERLSSLRDERTLHECGIAAPGRSRIPPASDPWAEADDLRVAKGVALGTVLSVCAWMLVVIGVLLVLAALT